MSPQEPTSFDFWYAISNTEIVSLPSRKLETFGNTMLNYHMISELMDDVNRVRVREGRIEAYKPQIIAPEQYMSDFLEGFNEEEAMKYAKLLRKELKVMRYGYMIKKEEFSEEVVTDNLEAVTQRVKDSVAEKNDPAAAVIVGVEDPWEVCLLKLVVQVIVESLEGNLDALNNRGLFGETDGVANVVRNEIEAGFRDARKDPALIKLLASKLERYGLFEKYEDRFFSLVKSGEES